MIGNIKKLIDIPRPHLRHLISHLAQSLGRAQDVSALLPGTQLTNFTSFIQDLPDGLLASLPCRQNNSKVRPINFQSDSWNQKDALNLYTWWSIWIPQPVFSLTHFGVDQS